jgi:hypothetical protein
MKRSPPSNSSGQSTATDPRVRPLRPNRGTATAVSLSDCVVYVAAIKEVVFPHFAQAEIFVGHRSPQMAWLAPCQAPPEMLTFKA